MEQRVNTLSEKVASMEARMEEIKRAQDDAHKERKILEAKQDTTNQQLHELLIKIGKWEGKFGGVLFAVGCLWAFFSGAGKAMLDWFKLLVTVRGGDV